MPFSLKSFLKQIKEAKHAENTLTRPETLTVLNHLKFISEDELLLDKIIALLSGVKSQQLEILSPREAEVFQLIGLSLTSKEISQLLEISEATVSTHRKNIIKKLGISGHGQLSKTAHNLVVKKKM